MTYVLCVIWKEKTCSLTNASSMCVGIVLNSDACEAGLPFACQMLDEKLELSGAQLVLVCWRILNSLPFLILIHVQ